MRLAHAALFLVVFVDLLGLGILAPLIPFYVQRLGVSPEVITLVIATYALCQFLGTPFWGAMSDRHGRKPILMISMAGHAASYLILAFADSVWLLVVSRALGGFTSANLATAYAYITDTTTDAERAAALGRISAAFGLGFIFGPTIGGLLASVGPPDTTNFVLPALTAMCLSLVSLLGIALFIPESAPKRSARPAATRPGLFRGLAQISRRPVMSKVVLLCFMTIVFVAARETIFPLWADAKHALSIKHVGAIISIGGLTLTVIQIFFIGRLVRRFGEITLVRTAIVLFAAGWTGLVLAESFLHIVLATMLTSVGTAFFQTGLQTLLSKRAAPTERGQVMGIYQSTSSLGRFTGQAASGTVYGQLGYDAPFLLGALVMGPAFLLAVWIARRVAAEDRATTAEAAIVAPTAVGECDEPVLIEDRGPKPAKPAT